jgi:hypothetical protein
MSLWLRRKPPRFLLNPILDPSPNGTVTVVEEKGGGAYRRRDCFGEVVEGVGEVLTVASMCGSSPAMVRVGRSTCAGGRAHPRRGHQPIQGGIVQLNGSESFTRGQGRHRREELENGSPDISVHGWWRVIEVRWVWLYFSGEAMPRLKLGEASQGLGEAIQGLGWGWGSLKWLATMTGARVARAGGAELAGAKGVCLASKGERGVRWGASRGGLKGVSKHGWGVALTCARGVRRRAPVRALASGHGVEHKAAQREVKFKRGLAPNLWDYGHDPVERSLPLTFLCCYCVEAYGFRWLDQEIWRGEVGFDSLLNSERRSRVWCV